MKWNLAVMDYLVTVQEMGLGPSMTDTSSCEENNTTYDDYHNLLFSSPYSQSSQPPQIAPLQIWQQHFAVSVTWEQ